MADDRISIESELAKIVQAMAAQEALRGTLSDEQLEIVLAVLRGRRDDCLARLNGSGAVAQGDHATAVGERGVIVDGNVGRDVITGTVINELPAAVLQLFARQFGFDPGASDAEALRSYFNNVVLERHSKLSFQFIRPERGQVYTESAVDVEMVFVPLQMMDSEVLKQRSRREHFGRELLKEEAERAVSLPEVLRKYPCLLLRGKPGSGKTTILRHIALAFARGEQQEKQT